LIDYRLLEFELTVCNLCCSTTLEALHKTRSYANGVKHGEETHFYLHGQAKSTKILENGLKHGVSVRWYEWGQVFEKRNWENGLKHHLEERWYPNGRLKVQCSWHKGSVSIVFFFLSSTTNKEFNTPSISISLSMSFLCFHFYY
jgi:hypothetical protein